MEQEEEINKSLTIESFPSISMECNTNYKKIQALKKENIREHYFSSIIERTKIDSDISKVRVIKYIDY